MTPSHKFPTWLRRILIAFGTLIIASAVMNFISAAQLWEASEEAALGITRREILLWCSAQGAAGIALLFLAFRRRR